MEEQQQKKLAVWMFECPHCSWKNFSYDGFAWEPEAKCSHCDELVTIDAKEAKKEK